LTSLILEILIVLVLTVINGLLAMSELAVVSSRPARLKVLAADGKRGANTAIKLAEDPGKFLSSVQIGITLVGVLSGAFSGATLGQRLADGLKAAGIDPSVADALGVVTVVIIITYISLIVGELVPKQLALRDPEGIATRVAPAMALIATIAAPLVFLLDISGKAVLTLLGQGGQAEEKVTEEEVRTLIEEAESAGVLESDERNMISGVMRLADRSARGLMTPRLEVEIVNLADDPAEILRVAKAGNRSRMPVQDGEPDSIIGVLEVSELFEAVLDGGQLDIRSLVKPAPVVMDHSEALDVVRAIRSSPIHMALVFDEYGHFEGIVTSGDILEAITGVFVEEEGGDEAALTKREDGSYLIAGWMPVDEFKEKFGIAIPKDARYETVAGYVLSEINRLPNVGEIFERGPWRFEVVDLDGRRIDKILMSPLNEEAS
jgi:putative hemolysin